MSFYRMILVLGVTAFFTGVAAAQPPAAVRPWAGGGMRGVGVLFKLQQKHLQKELQLTEEQIKKIEELGKKAPEKQREAVEKLMKAVEEENQKALGEILTPEQMKKLKQMEVRHRGPQALFDEDVHDLLKVTPEQKDKIKAIVEESRKEREETMKKLGEMPKETLKKVADVLTDEQKKAWREMSEPEGKRERRPEKKPEEKKPEEKKPEKKTDD